MVSSPLIVRVTVALDAPGLKCTGTLGIAGCAVARPAIDTAAAHVIAPGALFMSELLIPPYLRQRAGQRGQVSNPTVSPRPRMPDYPFPASRLS